MKISISVFLTCLLYKFTFCQDPHGILKEFEKSLAQKNLFRYGCQYRIKYFDSSDTTKLTNYNCIVSKAPNDTILNYFAKVYNSTEERIYDGVNFYMIWHNENKIVKDLPHFTGKRFVQNNILRQHIPSILFSKSVFKTYAESKEIILTEVKSENKACLRLEIYLPTDEEITFASRILYLEKESLMPMKIEGFAKYQDIQDEYWELRINNFETLQVNETDFTKYYNYPEDYIEETYETPQQSFDVLKNGSLVTELTGTDVNGNSKKINLQNNLILLDFWYLSCPPCIRAIPKLTALSEKYISRLKIIGVNPYDNPVSKADLLNKFSIRLNINYPLIFVDKSIAETFKIKTYPTMYLIKDGEIIYSHIGFKEESFNELETVIKDALKR